MYIDTQFIKWTVLTFIILFVSFFLLTRPIINLKSYSAHIKQIEPSPSISMPTITGINVSHYQGKIDWSKVLSNNVHFIYLKATEGITYTDPIFNENQNILIKNKAVYGAFHFFTAKDNGVKQAENFLSKLTINENMLPPVLDIEITQGVNMEILRKRAKEWLDTVFKKLNCKPIIYSYKSFYEENLGDEFLEYPFWIADYAKKPKLPSGVTESIIWQYTQKGEIAGIDTMVDKNLFFGDINKLNSIKCKYEKKDE